MKIFDQFSQEIQGTLTMFLTKYFKNKQKPTYWLDQVSVLNVLIQESDNVLELKVGFQDYLEKFGRGFWVGILGSRTRNFYKSLQRVLNDPDYSDKNLMITLAQEEKVAVDRKVRHIRRELRSAIKMIKSECRSLRNGMAEQTAEVARLTIENQLLITALVKLNGQYSKFVNENNAEDLCDEISDLKSVNKDMAEQNQRLIKIISVLIKRSSREVKKALADSGDSVGLIVLKLKKLSSKSRAAKPRGFFRSDYSSAQYSSSFGEESSRSSTECS